jgi:hypothetical protein
MRSLRSYVYLILFLSLFIAACDDSGSAPTPAPTPTPPPTTTPPPPPAPTVASLSGKVVSDSGNVIGGATVTVLDGPDTGRTVGVTGANGEYRFDQLTISNANFVARASGYEEDRKGTFVNGTNTLDFILRAVKPPDPPQAPLSITGSAFSTGPGYSEWRFTAVGTFPAGTNYRWDFGDDGVGSGMTDTHLYLEEGDFTVRVTATPRGGTPVTASLLVMVRF